MENISMLPQPATRSGGSVLRALNDLSESDSNARATMPPPSSMQPAGLKRQGSNLPEPALKRKIQPDRAVEPIRQSSNIARPQSAAGQNASNTTSLYRSTSDASSLSRSTSVSSRHKSNSSYTGSLSSGIRPPTGVKSASSMMRPKSSYGADKTIGAASKPARSLADLQASHEAQMNKSKDPLFPYLRGPRSTITLSECPMQNSTKATGSKACRNNGSRRIPSVVVQMRDRNRNVSFSTQMANLDLDHVSTDEAMPQTPVRKDLKSRTPRASPRKSLSPCVTPSLRHKSPMKAKKFLTPYANIEVFDPDEKYNDFKRMFEDYKQMHQDSMHKIDSEREQNNIFREKMTQLERERSTQTDSIITLKTENSTLQYQLECLEESMQKLKHTHECEMEFIRQQNKTNIETVRRECREEIDRLKNEHREELRDLKQKGQAEIDHERSERIHALSQVSTQGALEKQQHQIALERKDDEIAAAKQDRDRAESALEREKQMNNDLRESLKVAGDSASTMETTRQGLQAKIAYLESDSKSQSEAYAEMEKRMNEAIAKSSAIEDKLRKEETLRRKLHNQIQELKGNIRVFCRVRPTLTADEELAKMKYPNPEESTDIEVRGMDEKNSLGKDTTKIHPFSFDRVFGPTQSNDQVFAEVSQLIQSALDGYNVCIFAYGQTGSGKTHTMSSDDGMIPRALRQIYSTSKDLEERGWKYSMQGSFVEVYNEELRDLLGDEKEGSKRHDIHHDMESQETAVTNVTSLSLDNKEQVESILSQAMARRSVAATKANEHSSRSHSVFILKLVGKNSLTGEHSKGTLNLVDLAGSERIKNAETSGQRLKETQSINKSLSCLGDVIGALGQGQPIGDGRESLSMTHIPYRNSKLTYLLQLSLGGNCKTLMFVMVAPEKKCLGETITSLKFAEKVSKTRVGVARKTR